MYSVVILCVVCLVLWWRVWRLEAEVRKTEHVEFPSSPMFTVLNSFPIPHKMATNQDLRDLASALGYEWKSTPAKSGWERKHPLSNVCCVSTPLRSDKWGWLDEQPNDRRKADRRKPVDAPKKKPKRATH